MLKKISGRGFGSLNKYFELFFSEGITFFLGDNKDNPNKAPSNGSGKTTLLNAICWALYGIVPGDGKKDSLISRTSDFMEVTLEAGLFRIHRSKKRGRPEKLVANYNGEALEGDLASVQSQIDELFGMDYKTFCNTMYASRHNDVVQFIKAPSSQRMAILSNFIDVTDFKAGAELIQLDISSCEKTETRLNTIVAELTQRLPKLETSLQHAQERLESFTQSEKARKALVMDDIKDVKKEIQIQADRVKETKLVDGAYRQLEETKIEHQKKLQTLKSSIHHNKIVLDRMASSLTQEENCPHCGQLVDAAAAKHHEDERNHLIHSVEQEMREAARTESAIRRIGGEISQLREDQDTVKDAQHQIEMLRAEILRLQDTLQTPDMSYLTQGVAVVEEEIAEVRERLIALGAQLRQVVTVIPILRKLRLMFAGEVRNVMLDDIRHILQSYVNDYVNELAEAEFQIIFPETNKNAKDKFDVIMRSGGLEQDISRYSGGETWKAIIAVFFALRRYSLDVNITDAPWVLIDDPAGELDPGGMVAFMSLLERLLDVSHTRQILVTLPAPVPGMEHHNLVTVTRENRESTLTK